MEDPFRVFNRFPASERYKTDPLFRSVVDMSLSMLLKQQMTPTELREAVMLAATMFEETHIRPLLFPGGWPGADR